MSPKLEIVIRKIENHMIVAGVMISSNIVAETLAAAKVYCSKKSANEFTLHISKKPYNPIDAYGLDLSNYSLSDLLTQECWKGFSTPASNEFGGVMMYRDNQIFKHELSSKLSRVGVVSAMMDKDNILNLKDHAVFRSNDYAESDDWISFTMIKDVAPETTILLNTLIGNSALNIYKTPFWTLKDGSAYRLNTDEPLFIHELYIQSVSDIIKFGEPTKDVESKLAMHWRSARTPNHEYVEYLRAISKKLPEYDKTYSFLISEEEQEKIYSVSESILRKNF